MFISPCSLSFYVHDRTNREGPIIRNLEITSLTSSRNPEKGYGTPLTTSLPRYFELPIWNVRKWWKHTRWTYRGLDFDACRARQPRIPSCPSRMGCRGKGVRTVPIQNAQSCSCSSRRETPQAGTPQSCHRQQGQVEYSWYSWSLLRVVLQGDQIPMEERNKKKKKRWWDWSAARVLNHGIGSGCCTVPLLRVFNV